MNDYWGKVIQSVAMCIITLGNKKFDRIEEWKRSSEKSDEIKTLLILHKITPCEPELD